jgi:hypothetical protein
VFKGDLVAENKAVLGAELEFVLIGKPMEAGGFGDGAHGGQFDFRALGEQVLGGGKKGGGGGGGGFLEEVASVHD